MNVIPRLRSFFRAIFYRSRMESEMEQEMRDHMERYACDLMSQGLTPEEAQRTARAEFGVLEARKDECRDALGLRLWNDFSGDLRYALRMMRQSPGFSAVAILSLALGIGANSAIFSLAETVFLQQLPVKSPEALRILAWTSGPKMPMEMLWGACRGQTSRYCYSFSFPFFEELRGDSQAFSSLFAFKSLGRTPAVVSGHAETLQLTLVSGEYFSTLGVPLILGRTITMREERQKEFVAVISEGFWTRTFGRDPGVLGQHLSIADKTLTIIGVTPATFQGLHPSERPDVFAPITLQPEIAFQSPAFPSLLPAGSFWWVELAGRMNPEIGESAARTHLDLSLQRAVKAQLGNRKGDSLSLRFEPGAKGYDDLRFVFGKSLIVLIVVAGLVLLIACANLANLLLARATARQREMGVRLALGAGRGRLIRQMLTESLALAGLGGSLGLLFGFWSRNAIPNLLRVSWKPSPLNAHFDGWVLAFTLGVTLATGFLFGLTPALGATRVDLNSGLKTGSRGQTQSRVNLFAGKAIVIIEVSLSMLLLAGAGLFLRTLFNLQSVALGFNPQRIVLFELDPPDSRYREAKRNEFFKKVEDGVATIPGVEAFTLSRLALLSGSSSTSAVPLPNHSNEPLRYSQNFVGLHFFATMQIPLLRGREFNAHDRANSAIKIVINESLAKAYFPDSDPIGQTLGKGADSRGEVIGICRDTKYDNLRNEAPPTAYSLYAQLGHNTGGPMNVAIRSHVAPATLVAAMRKMTDGVDKGVPLLDIRTQAEAIEGSLGKERLFAALTVGFGILAVVLACIGVYGIMAYTVVRRTSEIGIRMALGAVSRGVLLMILRETFWLTLVGIGIGLAASLVLMRFVASMLYGLKPNDPVTLVVAFFLMAMVALCAGWLPARRAARLDPMTALRQE